ncbi:Ribosomal RNA small subunit methyltransferase H [Bacteroidales bacterium Barb6]|nr:Ribosomal RNA small subunit methyltransferase H [Bacteroidales bacterium Barb6]
MARFLVVSLFRKAKEQKALGLQQVQGLLIFKNISIFAPMKKELLEEREGAYHTPVLLKESLEGLAVCPSGVYADVTFGGGGHSREILKQLDSRGRLYGFDQDADAERNIPSDPRFVFVRSNFRYLYNFMRYHDAAGKADGVLADLGVSSHHFDDRERGFSFRFDGALDMRMNSRAGRTAADIVNQYSEAQLADVFYLYGELKAARKLAAVLTRARGEGKIETTGQLAEALKLFTGRDKEKKFLAQVFQALRIEVNDEMGALKEMLRQTLRVLKPGGRLAVLTYHSLEDRLVKNFLKTGNFEGKSEQDFYGNVQSPFRLVNNKVIVPSDEEIAANPRARSAKLRVGMRINTD